MLVSREEENAYYRLLDEIEEDRISLRELVPERDLFWRRRFNPVTQRQEWDQRITSGKVARDFYLN